MARQKSLDIRESILESATKVFARTGFYKAKAIEIARKANIAVGTIYNYFSNKDDILISIFEKRIGELNHSLRKAIREVDHPDEKLAVIIDSTISILQNDRELAEVVTIELRPSSKFFSSTAISSVTEFLDIITEVIRQGQQSGIYKADTDARIAALVVLGSLENLIHTWVLGDKVAELKATYDIPLEQGKEALKDLLKSGLRRETD
ncbi:MAG: TetR/AcrR family transcriptional regulator [Candidatus Hydrogenedentota bacterium]|nr:MAG: TetR/AcrR family transcriptional regulator [Candidatus Hydrogenedentota bacterium]